MSIISLTLNPAIDIHCYSESFKPFCENLAKITKKEAGGKGINISRALTVYGVENIAYVVVGGDNGKVFLNSLDDDNINYKALFVPGRIRENITLHTDNQPETRISFSGFSADEKLIDNIRSMLKNEKFENSIVTLTGRLPEGLNVEYVKDFLKELKSKGSKIVLDSRSFEREDIVDVKPWLIKPNEEEIKIYSGVSVTDFETAKTEALKLKSEGVENVIISMGALGAVLCCDDGVFFAEVPKIEVRSTIGAGDSTIAGFIAAMSDGATCEEAFKKAVSFGSASCMTEGTRPPKKEDIDEIFKRIVIKR